MVGIYFSGTGNSRYAAELFCREYDEATKAFSLEDDNITRVVKNEEMLVFACPVQYSTVPKILRDFIIENKELLQMSRELDIPLVTTNDVHYTYAEDAIPHDILLCLQTGKKLADEDRMRYEGGQYYVKSEEEMKGLFPYA